jgi:hypothetical protein
MFERSDEIDAKKRLEKEKTSSRRETTCTTWEKEWTMLQQERFFTSFFSSVVILSEFSRRIRFDWRGRNSLCTSFYSAWSNDVMIYKREISLSLTQNRLSSSFNSFNSGTERVGMTDKIQETSCRFPEETTCVSNRKCSEIWRNHTKWSGVKKEGGHEEREREECLIKINLKISQHNSKEKGV